MKAAEVLCCVILSCPYKGMVGKWKASHSSLRNTRQTWLCQKLRLRRPKLNPASRRPREGLGVDMSNPDEMEVCLSMVPVQSAIVDLVQKIERRIKKVVIFTPNSNSRHYRVHEKKKW